MFSKVTFQVLDWQIVGLIGEKCGRIHAQIELDIDENRAILLNPTPLDVTFNGDEKQWLCADIKRAYQAWVRKRKMNLFRRH